jgi:hypothetical protein
MAGAQDYLVTVAQIAITMAPAQRRRMTERMVTSLPDLKSDAWVEILHRTRMGP